MTKWSTTTKRDRVEHCMVRFTAPERAKGGQYYTVERSESLLLGFYNASVESMLLLSHLAEEPSICTQRASPHASVRQRHHRELIRRIHIDSLASNLRQQPRYNTTQPVHASLSITSHCAASNAPIIMTFSPVDPELTMPPLTLTRPPSFGSATWIWSRARLVKVVPGKTLESQSLSCLIAA